MWVGLIIGFVAGLATRPLCNAWVMWHYYRQGDDVLLSRERRLMMMKEEKEQV